MLRFESQSILEIIMPAAQLHYYPSNANLAPHILLEELGVAHELVLVDRRRDEHKSAAYLKLNPSGRIPAYVDGDLILFEAAAICLHLCDSHPRAGLAPTLGTAERAHFYKWLMYLTNTLQPELITYYYPDRLVGDAAAGAQVKAHARTRVAAMIDILEAEFARHGGPWLLGPHYSACDPYLLMLCRWTRTMERPARALPRLGLFLERMKARPAVQRAFVAEDLVEPWF